MWKKYPGPPEDEKDIKNLVAAAKKTLNSDAVKACDLVKQKYGNLLQFRAKGKDTKAAEKQVMDLYNDAFEAVKEASKVQLWKVVPTSDFKKELEVVKEGSEASKLKAWMSGIAKLGPMDAADAASIKCTPMSGNDFHVYLGKANRVYFTADRKALTVKLTGVKHEKEKK